MKKIFLTAIILIAIIAFAIFLSSNDSAPESSPTFSWRFEEAATLNPDGLPRTNVYLAIELDGGREVRLIDTVDGSCSVLEGESYEGVVSNTGKVQCYYAGLGQRYRITQSGQAYSIERQLFEEALPDMALPDYEWEVVEEVSFK